MTEPKEPLHPLETITSFLFIRHGHTQPVEDGKLYNDLNVPLTEKGVLQANQIALWLPTQQIEVLLTSPAMRARATAEKISVGLNLKSNVIADLDEWKIGSWEGRDYYEIRDSEPELYKKWSADPINNAPPEGESIAQLCNRIKESLEKLIVSYEGKKIALVTHAGVIRAALVYALEIPVQNFWRITVPTGSVAKIDFSKNFANVHYVSLLPGLNGEHLITQ